MHSAIHHRNSDPVSRPKYSKGGKGSKGQGRGQGQGHGVDVKRFRDPEMVIIRNKFTKEEVDLEVRF